MSPPSLLCRRAVARRVVASPVGGGRFQPPAGRAPTPGQARVARSLRHSDGPRHRGGAVEPAGGSGGRITGSEPPPPEPPGSAGSASGVGIAPVEPTFGRAGAVPWPIRPGTG